MIAFTQRGLVIVRLLLTLLMVKKLIRQNLWLKYLGDLLLV
jgi:hypothetical protein